MKQQKLGPAPEVAQQPYIPLQSSQFTQAAYQPIDYGAMAQQIMGTQQQYADANLANQIKGQDALSRNYMALQQELAPQQAALQTSINAQYAPQQTQTYLNAINQADPYFMQVRNKLGAQVGQGLDAGYSLGADLSREVEQDARGAQAARGNWFGPAPTADEAFQKASARIGLYNQRQQQATSFLQARGPGDLFGQYSPVMPYAPANVMTPQSGGLDPNLAAGLAQSQASGQNNYNAGQFSNALGIYDRNALAQSNNYDRQWDRYLYNATLTQQVAQPKSWFDRMMTGAQQGASEGSAGGPWGALGGAVGGAADGAANGPIYKAKMGDAGQNNYSRENVYG